MPQLDFGVVFTNFLSIIIFFIFFYITIYSFVLQRLFKMILIRKFFLEKFSEIKSSIFIKKNSVKQSNFLEFKKILINIKSLI